MKTNLLPTLCSIGLILLITDTGKADDFHFQAGIGSHAQHFYYEEFDSSGQSLNQEEGALPGLIFFGRYSNNHLLHQFSAMILGGDVDYDGQTQIGMPHQTTTRTHLYNLSYRLEADVLPQRLAAYFSANWDYWSRSIQPSGAIIGLDETYRWPSLSLGLKLPLVSSGKHALHFSSAYLHILKGKFTVDLDAIGFGKPELELGSGEGFESTLHYTFKLPEASKAGIELYYRQWSFARSDAKTLSNGASTITFLEPRSKNKRLGLAFTLAVPF